MLNKTFNSPNLSQNSITITITITITILRIQEMHFQVKTFDIQIFQRFLIQISSQPSQPFLDAFEWFTELQVNPG